MLVFRHLDFDKLFILYTNISKKEIGIVLCQKDEEVKVDYIIQYYSQTLADG